MAQGRSAGEGYWILRSNCCNGRTSTAIRRPRDRICGCFRTVATFVGTAADRCRTAPRRSGEPGAVPEGPPANVELLAWQGILPARPIRRCGKLAAFSDGKHAVPIDMSGVDRVDFVCAGSLFNAISTCRIAAQDGSDRRGQSDRARVAAADRYFPETFHQEDELIGRTLGAAQLIPRALVGWRLRRR